MGILVEILDQYPAHREVFIWFFGCPLVRMCKGAFQFTSTHPT
jgi:hypothetical protein